MIGVSLTAEGALGGGPHVVRRLMDTSSSEYPRQSGPKYFMVAVGMDLLGMLKMETNQLEQGNHISKHVIVLKVGLTFGNKLILF